MDFDLLIKGGDVMDPGADLEGRLDVAVSGDRIAVVEPDIPAARAARVVDASGQLVTPGLIDLHSHVFWGRDYFGIEADSIAPLSGVTTWVDAGSAGAFSMPAFEAFVARPARVRILAFINISYLGIPGLNYDEYCNPAACDVDLLVRAVRAAPDLVVGIKTRMGDEGFCHPGLQPLRQAIKAGDATGLPVMCHISESPPPVDEVLALLRPGDMVTHSYTGAGQRLVDGEGRLLNAVRHARDRGVLFDLGHGAGSFSFRSAEALAAAGFWPDTISTDLHQLSLPGSDLVADQELVAQIRGDGTPRFTMLTAMTKLLSVGMPLRDVVHAATARPAAIIGGDRGIGTLTPGAMADIAVLELRHEPVTLVDIGKQERRSDRSLHSVATFVGGQELEPVPMPPDVPWIERIDAA